MTALKQLTDKFALYLLVGLANTTTCLFLMSLGASLGLHYLTYTAIAYSVTILLSFYMNLRYTFRAQGNLTKRLSLFLLISLTNLIVVEFFEYILIESFSANKLTTIFLGMSWYTLSGFLANNFLVYKEKFRSYPS